MFERGDVGVVAAVLDEAVVKEQCRAPNLGEQAEPPVVHGDALGEREGGLEEPRPEGHATSDERVLFEIAEETRARLTQVEHGGSERAAALINKNGVMDDGDDIGIFHLGEYDADLFWLPDVVLIRQEDDVAPSLLKGVGEVLNNAVSGTLEYMDVRVRFCEPAEDLQCPIRRAVVGHNDLEVAVHAGEDRRELFFKILSAIESGHTYGVHLSIAFLHALRRAAYSNYINLIYRYQGSPSTPPAALLVLLCALLDQVGRGCRSVQR